MKAYIDKSALVAEIEKELNTAKKYSTKYVNGKKYALKKILSFLDTLEVNEVEKEPVSNDLEREIKHYIYDPYFDLNGVAVKGATDYLTVEDVADIARHFAQWQKEQMEKNRIAHCDNITDEQYNLETGFLDDFLDKNKRMPTFLDAIEYGMKKAQKGE